MRPSVEGQQRRVVSALVRRNLQGWGRPLDFTVQRLRMGAIFGGLGVLFFFLRQPVLLTHSSFFTSVVSLLTILSFAFCFSFFLTHIVPFLRARSQVPITITGNIAAAVCDPQEYTPVSRGDYHFITFRPTNAPLRAYAVEAGLHDDVCARKGQQVTLDVIPGIDRVVRIR